MHEAKQTYLLGPILDQPNFSKLSYIKAKELAMKKVIESESQQVKKSRTEANNMTAE